MPCALWGGSVNLTGQAFNVMIIGSGCVQLYTVMHGDDDDDDDDLYIIGAVCLSVCLLRKS